MKTMRRGFTLIELMVVGAIAVVILLLAAPSFQSMIEMQRLRAVAAQFATDVQFARSEAPSRQRKVYLGMGANASLSCYVIYVCGPSSPCTPCDCTAAPQSRCPVGVEEIRSQQLPASEGIRIGFVVTDEPAFAIPPFVTFDPATGGLDVSYAFILTGPVPTSGKAWAEISSTRPINPPRIRTEIAVSGRPSQCAPAGLVTSVSPCAP